MTAPPKAAVLMYHHVCLRPESPWDVSPEQLGAHVRAARDLGFSFGTLRDLATAHNHIAVLTFDDAYGNVYENAVPVLQELKIPATVFVPVNYAGGMNTFDYLLDSGTPRPERIMSWSQLSELSALGWAIESHGCSHLPLSLLGPVHIEDEVRRSKLVIEDHIGRAVGAFAYPFGDVPAVDVHRLFEAAGYQCAVLAYGAITALPFLDPFRIPRLPMTGDVPFQEQ